MSIESAKAKFLLDISALIIKASERGVTLRAFWFHRTAEQQHALFEDPKNLTKCDGYVLRSKHQDWLAIDLVIVWADGTLLWADAEIYAWLGELWEKSGNKWGGRFKDPPDNYHFEAGDQE